MPRTPDERRAINRENARHSTGPRSAEGKARSRNNALKHGLRAATPAALPNEDPEAIQARADEWNDYYRPKSPAARHLVDECVRATLLADRCDRHHSSALARQVRAALDEWDGRKTAEFVGLIRMLQTDPAEAFRGLNRSGNGCRGMIGLWEALRQALRRNGCWDDDERDKAIRLLGTDPSPDRTHLDEVAYAVRLHNTLLRTSPSAPEVTALLEPRRMPPDLRGGYSARSLPRPDESRAFLAEVVDTQLGPLYERERYYREEVEGPDRAEAADRALVLQDGASARLFLRYHAEARSAFHRAYKALVQTLDRDEDEAEADADDPPVVVSPNEPNAAAGTSPIEPNVPPRTPADAPAVLPNEPNPAGRRVFSPNEPNTRGLAAAGSVELAPNEPNPAEDPDVFPNEPNDEAAGSAPRAAADGTRGGRKAKGRRAHRADRSARRKANAR